MRTRPVGLQLLDVLAPPKSPRFDALVLGGGGARVFSMLGALHKLRKTRDIGDDMTCFVGTSAGALLATALAQRMDISETYRAFLHLRYEADLDFGALTTKYGLDSGKSLEKAIAIVAAGDDTFADIRARHGTKLVVCATNLSRRRPEYFGPDSHPDMRVALALRMSCAVPIFFTAVRHGDDVFVDGGVSDNFPWGYDLPNAKRKLGIRFAPSSQPVNTLDSFLGALVESCATAPALSATAARGGDAILELREETSTVDFKIDVKKRHELFRNGHAQAAAFAKKRS